MDEERSIDGGVERSSPSADHLNGGDLGAAIDELLAASENVSESSQSISDLASEQSENMREVR